MTPAAFIFILCRWVLGILFGVAAVKKVQDLNAFQQGLEESFEVSARWVPTVSVVVVVVEFGVAISLLAIDRLHHWAIGVAGVILMGFTGVLLRQLWRHKVVKCNCFGQTDRPVSVVDVLRNFVLVGAAALYWLFAPAQVELNGVLWVLMIGLALWFAVLTMYLHELVYLLLGRA